MGKVDCSVIILVHNGLEYTQKCFANLLAASSKPREVICVNNGSTDGTAEFLKSMKNHFKTANIDFNILTNTENLGCSVARNMAWEKAHGKYIVFMDNDAAVCTGNWLEIMAEFLETNHNYALVGAKMIYPFKPHSIQCAGVNISPKGRICFRGRGKKRDDEKYNTTTDVHALISACWMMHSSLAQSIGMLDKEFHPVQYEDIDFCMRILEKGMNIAYLNTVEIYHFEGMTTASFGQENYVKNIAANSAKFREKWQKIFSTFKEQETPESYKWLSREELNLTSEENLKILDQK